MIIHVLIFFILVITHGIFLILYLLVVRLHLELSEVRITIEPVFLARIVIAVHVTFSLGGNQHILLLVGGLHVGIDICHPVRLSVIAFDQFLSLDGAAGYAECIIDLGLAQPCVGPRLAEIELLVLSSCCCCLLKLVLGRGWMEALITADDFHVLQAERLIHSEWSAAHWQNLVSLRA